MKTILKGDLLTARDITEIEEIQRCLDCLPWALKKYYILKARYFALRTKALGGIIALGTIVLGVLTYTRTHDLLMPLLLLGFGVIVGLIIAWEVGRHSD